MSEYLKDRERTMKLPSDEVIHKGHRQRMYKKLLRNGERSFEDYELLEMLLYSVIPYKDTSPMAKRLICAFDGLFGVFSAEAEALMRVPGVGKAVAELIISAGALFLPDGEVDEAALLSHRYDDYGKAGRFFVEYFSGVCEPTVAAAVFDNQMNMIAVDSFFKIDYGSGGVTAKPFIDFALKHRASVIMTAHLHPYGPLFPSLSDVATNKMLDRELSTAGVILAEHYIVSGDNYLGAMTSVKPSLMQSPELERFYRSKGEVNYEEP